MLMVNVNVFTVIFCSNSTNITIDEKKYSQLKTKIIHLSSTPFLHKFNENHVYIYNKDPEFSQKILDSVFKYYTQYPKNYEIIIIKNINYELLFKKYNALPFATLYEKYSFLKLKEQENIIEINNYEKYTCLKLKEQEHLLKDNYQKIYIIPTFNFNILNKIKKQKNIKIIICGDWFSDLNSEKTKKIIDFFNEYSNKIILIKHNYSLKIKNKDTLLKNSKEYIKFENELFKYNFIITNNKMYPQQYKNYEKIIKTQDNFLFISLKNKGNELPKSENEINLENNDYILLTKKKYYLIKLN